MSFPSGFGQVSCANKIVRFSVPTKVNIYPGLPHGFRRWTNLHATEAFDSDIVKSMKALIKSPEGSQEWENPWTIYSVKAQGEPRESPRIGSKLNNI